MCLIYMICKYIHMYIYVCKYIYICIYIYICMGIDAETFRTGGQYSCFASTDICLERSGYAPATDERPQRISTSASGSKIQISMIGAVKHLKTQSHMFGAWCVGQLEKKSHVPKVVPSDSTSVLRIVRKCTSLSFSIVFRTSLHNT